MPKESDIIAHIRKRAGAVEGLRVGIGDDAAVIETRGATDVLACCDVSVEGVHFRRAWATPKLIGRKALAVTLSDIAAMGGAPRYALVSVALPRAAEATLAAALMEGIFALADESGVTIIGGDTSSSPDSLFLDTIVIGECASNKAVTRGGAQTDDLIFVTGSLGASALGLALLEQGYRFDESVIENGEVKPAEQGVQNKMVTAHDTIHADEKLFQAHCQQAMRKHLRPEPRWQFGRALGESGLATAMIDVSDGFSTDLWHILEESNCGAQIQAARMPLAAGVSELAQSLPEVTALHRALHSGEEYELLFTARGENQSAVFALAAALRLPVTLIGKITRSRELLIEGEGTVEVLLPAGYEHQI
ncbi:MAG: thiamine-phosphate kinase [Acidobacteria bacterium]|nr:thiamine-phosphate kinase [Acidobacteriota bacterium]